MSVRMVDHSAELIKLMNAASAEGIERCTTQYRTLAKQAVSVPNSGRDISSASLRKQARQQLGKRTKGLVTIVSRTKGGEIVKATHWYDTGIDNNKRTTRIYPFPSKPGEPPRKRSGAGWEGIQQEVDRKIPAGRVGVLPGVKYMVYLNYGTKRVAARPWIELTLNRNQATFALLLQTGARSVMR